MQKFENINGLDDFLNVELFTIGRVVVSINLIISIIFVIIITSVLLKLIKRMLNRYGRKEKVDQGNLISIFQITKYIFWVTAIAIIISLLGFNITLILASSAALLVGLGLGIQYIFSDYVSGLLLLFENNVRVGDILEINNDIIGQVVKIGLRTSRLKTRDDIVVIIPNSKLISENTINWTNLDRRIRFNVKVGVAYGSDTEKVKSVLLDCAHQIESISKDKKPIVQFIDFGESSLDFQLFFWTSNTFYVENVKSDLRFLIDREFRKNNISIPFPQRDLHIISDK